MWRANPSRNQIESNARQRWSQPAGGADAAGRAAGPALAGVPVDPVSGPALGAEAREVARGADPAAPADRHPESPPDVAIPPRPLREMRKSMSRNDRGARLATCRSLKTGGCALDAGLQLSPSALESVLHVAPGVR